MVQGELRQTIVRKDEPEQRSSAPEGSAIVVAASKDALITPEVTTLPTTPANPVLTLAVAQGTSFCGTSGSDDISLSQGKGGAKVEREVVDVVVQSEMQQTGGFKGVNDEAGA
ncbi:hypothetical protein VNO78_21905 [Psophocarpus tetragonolobus]|uniref:Uncharacterized protein n=1 Tax=Psophocarpus tetragonolobus TaxID=3891 RepID=A0AAN9XHZ9_PSOTE